MAKIRITNTQKWLREHSFKLESSFRSSGLIQHKPTKGVNRESQVLHTLSGLLPKKLSIIENVVICDSTDAQSQKFDGALIDFSLWPRLFADEDTTCAMLESIRAAIEVKSSLNKKELDDIFSKSASLRQMSSAGSIPYVTAFSYECPNSNLSFFDFSTLFISSPELSPSLVCILNKHLFCLARFEAGIASPTDEPSRDVMPVLFSPYKDTLLVYLYFLSRWVTSETDGVNYFKSYSDNVFKYMECFHFDRDFLDVIQSDKRKLLKARKCFQRKAESDITSLYAEARSQLGLPQLI
jgi:hypothetical protein